jgi:succinyl-diaminopimelate desuccinylase
MPNMPKSDTLQLTQELIARAIGESHRRRLPGAHDRTAAKPIGFRSRELCASGRSITSGPSAAAADPVFCFAGHTDVVPSGPLDEWHSDPFQPVIKDGLLYGRGAADMKSGLAAMLTASEEFVGQYPKHRGTIAFLITSDEEGPSVDGTRRVVEVLRERQRAHRLVPGRRALERETLGDTIKIGRRGSLSGRLTVHGMQGHIAYPQSADNPVHALAPALAELTARTWDQGNEHFQPTTFQVSNISAGTGAPNVIPGELGALQSALLDRANRRGLEGTVEESCDRIASSTRWSGSFPDTVPDRPGTLSQAATSRAVQEQFKITPKLSTGGGTSDGRFIAPMGAAGHRTRRDQ